MENSRTNDLSFYVSDLELNRVFFSCCSCYGFVWIPVDLHCVWIDQQMRPPCCDKLYVKRGPWSEEEDAKILAHVSKHGTGNWTSVPKKAGLRRCGKSCRLRWTNYLRPEVKHESFSAEEEDLIIKLHSAIGSRWAIIAQQLPGRTDNDVKNYWNTKLKKKLTEKGIDPVTHRPFSQILRDYDSIGGIPTQSRIGSISKELKNAFYTGQDAYHQMTQSGAKPELPESCYSLDLLAQLQAIKLVTEGSSRSAARESFSPPSPFFVNGGFSLPSPSSTSSSSASSSPSSTCSTAAAAQEKPATPTHNFSWSEFLLEETSFPSSVQEKTAEWTDSERRGAQKQMGDGEIHCPGNGVFNNGTSIQAPPLSPSSGSSFVEDMLKRDGDMFMEFPELWEEPHY